MPTYGLDPGEPQLLQGQYHRPTGYGQPGVILADFDPLEFAEAVRDVAQRNWDDILARKGATFRSELIGQAAAAAAYGNKLPFPFGFIAGAAGKEVLPPGSLSLSEYYAFLIALNKAQINGRSILARAPGAGGRVIRFAGGPVGAGITGGSVIYFRYFNPDPDRQSPGWQIARGLLTGGIDEIGIGEGGNFPLPLGFYVLNPVNGEDGEAPLTQLLVLVPFWQKDP